LTVGAKIVDDLVLKIMTGGGGMLSVAVLGLGEAGARYAADLLAAGAAVAGYDPVARPELPGLRLAASAAEAAAGAELVLSLNSAGAAERVARDAAAGLAAGVVYADLNTGSPDNKRQVAAACPGGVLFADVAVLAPVPRAGLHTPLLAAGPGRGRLAALLEPLGVPVADAGEEPGAAAARKLLRSVFMKGLAAVVMEALEAAEAAGQQPWLREQIDAELTAADAALVDRLVTGTRRHAVRRLAEMTAVSAYLAELGVGHQVTDATVARLAALTRPEGDR
jgi:3-hydroxyisobutyrate dehydrogenase-like beta-hydroxyacid dehydrogenase